LLAAPAPYCIEFDVSTSRKAAEVRLVLVLLDLVAVRLGVGLPVDVLQLVAGHVLAVLGELHARAVVRALVHARQHALGQALRAEGQVGEAGEQLGLDDVAQFLGHGVSAGGKQPRTLSRVAGVCPGVAEGRAGSVFWSPGPAPLTRLPGGRTLRPEVRP
jgi:hypothetical protein